MILRNMQLNVILLFYFLYGYQYRCSFAPTAAVEIMKYAQNSLGVSEGASYHFALPLHAFP